MKRNVCDTQEEEPIEEEPYIKIILRIEIGAKYLTLIMTLIKERPVCKANRVEGLKSLQQQMFIKNYLIRNINVIIRNKKGAIMIVILSQNYRLVTDERSFT